MRWFGRKTAQVPTEARWTVAVDVAGLTVIDPAERVARLEMHDLSGVMIETNDLGPFATDVWWLLFGPGEHLACRFPLGATGQNVALDRLGTLSSFDHGQMGLAMGSTKVADSHCGGGRDERKLTCRRAAL